MILLESDVLSVRCSWCPPRTFSHVVVFVVLPFRISDWESRPWRTNLSGHERPGYDRENYSFQTVVYRVLIFMSIEVQLSGCFMAEH